MEETKYVPSTFKDVDKINKSAANLLDDSRWNDPVYEWTIDHTQAMNALPIPELANHLKLLVVAKNSLSQLLEDYNSDLNYQTNTLNDNIKTIENNYHKFKHDSRHPNEVAYRLKHEDKLPEKEEIDYSSRRFGHIILWISIPFVFMAILLHSMVSGPDAIVNGSTLLAHLIFYSLFAINALIGWTFLFASPILLLAAKHGWRISQPWASYKNYKRMETKRKILNADKEFCQNNDCSDETLNAKFQYDESFPPLYSSYAEQQKMTYNDAKSKLTAYSNVIRDNIIFFPPEQTKNTYRLYRIYEALLSGVPSWSLAFEHVSQDERTDKITNTVTEALKTASSAIINSINDAENEISDQLYEVNEQLGDIKEETKQQTAAINYWGRVETTIAGAQTALMLQTDHRIGEISSHY